MSITPERPTKVTLNYGDKTVVMDLSDPTRDVQGILWGEAFRKVKELQSDLQITVNDADNNVYDPWIGGNCRGEALEPGCYWEGNQVKCGRT